jgi:hypothetical protein
MKSELQASDQNNAKSSVAVSANELKRETRARTAKKMSRNAPKQQCNVPK